MLRPPPPGAVTPDPADEGGDPACWLHLLEDEEQETADEADDADGQVEGGGDQPG